MPDPDSRGSKATFRHAVLEQGIRTRSDTEACHHSLGTPKGKAADKLGSLGHSNSLGSLLSDDFSFCQADVKLGSVRICVVFGMESRADCILGKLSIRVAAWALIENCIACLFGVFTFLSISEMLNILTRSSNKVLISL